MLTRVLSLACLVGCLASPLLAVPISIVPDAGISGTSTVPFITQTRNLQQFTSSSAFSALGGPAYLRSLDFNSVTVMAVGTSITATGNSIEAGFSSVPLGSLTTNMATNLSNPLTLVASSYSLVSQAGFFNWHIEFATPILYDPSQGNLVLQFTSATNTGISINGNVSSSNTVSVFDNPSGQFNQSRVFQFNFDIVDAPELSPASAALPFCWTALGILILLSKRREKTE